MLLSLLSAFPAEMRSFYLSADNQTLTTGRNWRSITIAASARLANRVNASSHPIDI